MAIFTAQYSLSSTPTEIVPNNFVAEEVHIHVSSGSAYIGDSTVSATTGLRIDNGDKLMFNTHVGSVYAMSSGSASMTVAVIEK